MAVMRMNKHGLTKENLLRTFPLSLQMDESVLALADVTAHLLARRPGEIERLRIYPAIDSLDEKLLDILAYDYKVDWWDADYSLEEKRRTLADSWRVHKILGTKTAVETAIRAIYPRTRVLEWFEYGGEPYHFRLDINITNDSIDSVKQRRVLERLAFYKNLRSHNDGVTYFVEAKPAFVSAVTTASGLEESACIPLEIPVPIIRPTAAARVGVTTGLRENFSAAADISVPVLQSRVTARTKALSGWEETFTAQGALTAPSIRPAAAVRAGAVTGLWEAFTAAIDITAPAVQSRIQARTKARTGMEETFITRAVLPIAGPPAGTARLYAGVSGAWQESYTTEAVPLVSNALSAASQAEVRSAVSAAQETAETFIDLRR